MFVGTALVLTGFVLAAYAADVFDDSELDTVDGRFAIRGDLAPPEDIAIVGIDDPSIDRARRALALPAHVCTPRRSSSCAPTARA